MASWHSYVLLVCSLFADQLAEQGFLVFLPDIFKGDCWAAECKWATFTDWKEIHPQGPQVLQLNRLLTDIQQQYRPKHLSSFGFCWGGHHSVLLAQTDKVSAAAVAHGSNITKDMVQAVRQPLLFLFCDNVSHWASPALICSIPHNSGWAAAFNVQLSLDAVLAHSLQLAIHCNTCSVDLQVGLS